MHSTETELLSALRAGTPAAVRQWYKKYHTKLVCWLELKVTSQADAEEIAQEVFVNCLRHLPLFRGDSGIWSWMLGIARHEVADYFRKKYAKKAIAALPLSELVVTDRVQDAHEVSERVKVVIEQLSAEAQELLLLKYVDQKSVKDIAVELGKSLKAVESELFRARQEFRARYADLEL